MTENSRADRRRAPRPGQAPAPRTAPAPRPGAAARPSAPVRPVPARPSGARRPAPAAAPNPVVRRAPQPARPASSASSPARGYIIPSYVWGVILTGVIILIAGFMLQAALPNFSVGTANTEKDESLVAEIHGNGPLRLNELMSSNEMNITDETGKTRDWVEVANISNKPVSLSGYTLAKKENAPNVFEFPNVTLGAGECVIVFADSTLKNEAGSEYHAPFRLSSQGGSLMLFGPSGTAVDSVNYPALPANAVYARQSRNQWVATQMTTPGMLNTSANDYAAQLSRTESGVEITEVVAKNTLYPGDESGLCQDYVELHNTSGEVKDLSGWYLSDDVDRPMRWVFPADFVLQPDEYRIVFCTGQDTVTETAAHTSFGLNTEGETITLTAPHGTQVDQVTYDLLGQDEAWSKTASGSWAVQTPTPNAAN